MDSEGICIPCGYSRAHLNQFALTLLTCNSSLNLVNVCKNNLYVLEIQMSCLYYVSCLPHRPFYFRGLSTPLLFIKTTRTLSYL